MRQRSKAGYGPQIVRATDRPHALGDTVEITSRSGSTVSTSNVDGGAVVAGLGSSGGVAGALVVGVGAVVVADGTAGPVSPAPDSVAVVREGSWDPDVVDTESELFGASSLPLPEGSLSVSFSVTSPPGSVRGTESDSPGDGFEELDPHAPNSNGTAKTSTTMRFSKVRKSNISFFPIGFEQGENISISLLGSGTVGDKSFRTSQRGRMLRD